MARTDITNRALGAVLLRALTRWESLVTIAITGILFLFVKDPFPWWQDWFWLVAGAIAQGSFLISSLSDPDANADAIAREFEQRFDLRRIKSPVSREQLDKALNYRRNMMQLVKQHDGAMRVQLQQTVSDVNDWIAHMYDLALHIDALDDNTLVAADRRRVPQEIQKVKQRIQLEKSDAVRQDLQEQLERLELQLDNLNSAFDSAKRAEIQLNSTLSSLGTVFAQMSVLGTREVDSSRAQRLRLEIRDEVDSLQDTIHAMDEVQAQSLRLR